MRTVLRHTENCEHKALQVQVASVWISGFLQDLRQYFNSLVGGQDAGKSGAGLHIAE